MKLDTGKAWNDATRMFGANRELVLVLAGIFFFVPLMILLIALFGAQIDFGGPNAEPDPERVAQQINAVIGTYWWAILLVSLGQMAGAVAIIGLLGDPGKPTVGEAIGLIPRLILTVIAAQILTALAAQALPLLAGALPLAVRGIVNLILLPITIYITVKLSLAAAVIVIERQLNPLKALARSWNLTKGNSLRIFLFYLLLIIAVAVVGIVAAIGVGLILALLGDRAQQIGGAIVLSALIAGYYALSYAVTTAIYRQLAGPSDKAVAGTFE